MIVGWRCAFHMRTEMVLDAIEMARWGPRNPPRRPALPQRRRQPVHVSPLRRMPRDIGATPSIGNVGDSYDNALAETVNGHYKTELIRGLKRPEFVGDS